MMGMKENNRSFAIADERSCLNLFGSESHLVMKRTSCRLVAADFVVKRCGVVLPDKVKVVGFDTMKMGEVEALLKRFHSSLSLYDAASLFVASNENAILITDDRAIRRCAHEIHVETMSCETFVAQVAEVEADGAPPLSLSEERRKIIKGIETSKMNQIETSYYE